MQILVTGAAGFLGTLAVRHALAGPPGWPGVTRVTAVDVQPCTIRDNRVDVRVGSLTDPAFVRSIVGPELHAVLHLAAVVSGQAEAEFDRGFTVNVDGTRALLEACRGAGARPRLVFASTVSTNRRPNEPVPPVTKMDLPSRSRDLGAKRPKDGSDR